MVGGAAALDLRHSAKRSANLYLAVLSTVFVALSAVLLEDAYVRSLLKEALADSSGVGIAVLTVAWWCLLAWLAATLLSRVSHHYLFPRDNQPRRRQILSDLASALIYLGALFGILQFAFHQPLTGLLATSGIVALVIGLALQSTLADLFSGIALNIEAPFRAGDWISVDGANDGQVIEINWRATRIREGSGDITIIPNSQIAKSRVTNHCLPEKVHPGGIHVDIAVECAFEQVEQALTAAVCKARNVLISPPPEVTVLSIQSQAVSYGVAFYVADYADVAPAQCAALRQVLAAVARADLTLAGGQTQVYLCQEPVRQNPLRQDIALPRKPLPAASLG
jgi:small-conductance mechanosensitive channel